MVSILWHAAAAKGHLRIRIRRLGEGPPQIQRVRIACTMAGKPAAFNITVQDDRRLAIFPEGNYGPKEGELMPFHKGFAHFAIKAGVPVIPVVLSGTKDLWLRKKVQVVIGPALASAGQDPAALTALAYQKMSAMMPVYTEPGGRKLLRDKLTHLF